MTSYSVEVRRGDHVLHSIARKEFTDHDEAWKFAEQLSFHYDSPGLRVVVKDENGGVFLMAGLRTIQNTQAGCEADVVMS